MNRQIYKILQTAHVPIFGILWGCSEIFLGGILYAYKIPEYGISMAAIGAMIVLTGSTFSEKKGSIFLMGLVAAILKVASIASLNFSLIIAILAEALVGEIALFIWGKNKLSFAIAGSGMVFYCFLHRFISKYLIYGKSVTEVYTEYIAIGNNIFGVAVEHEGFILLLFFTSYAIIGSLAGYAAWKLGHCLSRISEIEISQ